MKTLEIPAALGLKPTINEAILTLHNDDHNTFDHVITCLRAYCDHTLQQAEQCAMIVHNNGKCDVKIGEREHLTIIKDLMTSEGLSVTIS